MAADDLTLAPHFTLPITTEYKTLVSAFENGAEQRRQKRTNAIRKWKLMYNNISSTDKGTLQTLFDNQKGQATSFLWTDPLSSTQYTVRFASDQLECVLKAYNVFDVSFELVQVV